MKAARALEIWRDEMADIARSLRGEPCGRCGGFCTNGAECAVARYLRKKIDWRTRPTTITGPWPERNVTDEAHDQAHGSEDRDPDGGQEDPAPGAGRMARQGRPADHLPDRQESLEDPAEAAQREAGSIVTGSGMRLHAPGVVFRGDEPFTIHFIEVTPTIEENEKLCSAWDKMHDRWRAAVAKEPAVNLAEGDAVVFTGSDPATRREWVVEKIDRPRFSGEPRTCTIRRGSTVKRGVSLSRLEKAE